MVPGNGAPFLQKQGASAHQRLFLFLEGTQRSHTMLSPGSTGTSIRALAARNRPLLAQNQCPLLFSLVQQRLSEILSCTKHSTICSKWGKAINSLTHSVSLLCSASYHSLWRMATQCKKKNVERFFWVGHTKTKPNVCYLYICDCKQTTRMYHLMLLIDTNALGVCPLPLCPFFI